MLKVIAISAARFGNPTDGNSAFLPTQLAACPLFRCCGNGYQPAWRCRQAGLLFPTFASGDNRAERKEQDVKKWIAHLGGLARIAQLTKMLAEPVDFHDDTPAKGSTRSHPDPLVKSLELLKKHS